jgi:putative ABC transport system permease protein
MAALSKLEIFWQDARFGARMLRKNPGFTALVVLTVSLGIGANTAIFSVVNAVLLHPLPIRDPTRLVVLHDQFPTWNMPRTSVLALQFIELGQRTDLFESSAAIQPLDLNLTDRDHSLRLQVMAATSGLFPLLGIKPVLGRTFTDADNTYERTYVTRTGEGSVGHRVAILSYGLWGRLFGNNPRIVGKQLQLEGFSYEIIGVLPEKLEILYPQTELWVPAAFSPKQVAEERRWYVGYTMLARLHRGVTLQRAQAGLAAAMARFNDEEFKFGVEVRPLIEEKVGDVRAPLSILFGAVGVVLLIACMNIANLLLARNSTRSREIAIRAALGAPGGRIVSQLLTEGLLLLFAGGCLGLLGAQACMSILVRYAPADLPHAGAIRLDPSVLGFTLVVSLLAGVLFGLGPALLSARTELSEAMKQVASSGGRGRGGRKPRPSLVVFEVALG